MKLLGDLLSVGRQQATYLLVGNKLLLAICLGAACTCACSTREVPEVKSQISESWERQTCADARRDK